MKFAEHLERFGGQVALLVSNGSSLTYTELAQQCDALNTKLGAGKKLIFVFCGNNIETVVGYVSALRGGHTVLMLDKSADLSAVSALIEIYEPNFLWKPDSDDKYYELETLNQYAHSSLNPDLALLLSTSGTTGSPKLVKLTLDNIYNNAASISEYLQITADERPITTLPLYYSYGLSVINSHLAKGAGILLTDHALTQREFWQFFKEQQATSLSGVPYTYEMLKLLRFSSMQLPSLRTMTQAGGKLDANLVKEFAEITQKKNIRFFVMYGQTEATARIAYLPYQKILQKPGSVGIAIPGGHVWLEDDDNNTITTPGTTGELIYSGSNVMMGYAETKDDFSLSDIMGGILRTGDLAHCDEDGFIFITGRKKRFLKMFGNRVNLVDIEQFIFDHGHLIACVGEDDHLFVVCKNVDELTTVFIKKLITKRYTFHHSAVTTVSINEFPMSGAGKIMYRELFDDIKNGQK